MNAEEAYRLRQAEELLQEAEFPEQPDGSWVPEEDPAPQTTRFAVGFRIGLDADGAVE